MNIEIHSATPLVKRIRSYKAKQYLIEAYNIGSILLCGVVLLFWGYQIISVVAQLVR